jgi:DNA polymerase III delta prime subunit
VLPDELKKQEFSLRVLEAHVRRGRLAHTYLFSGSSPRAQASLALCFAALLNGDANAKMGDMETRTAKRIRDRNHPDVLWLGEDEKVRSLKIAEVREVISWCALKPYEGPWKVVIVEGAERLTVDAQNAFLKTLEEPPAQTLFCLLVESTDNLLETIRSRAFHIRMSPDEAVPEELRPPEGVGQKKWEDLLEDYQSASRFETLVFMDELMAYFRDLLKESAAKPEIKAYRQEWLRAIALFYETKDALDANANQKLALTRLAMHLKRLLPSVQMIKPPEPEAVTA